jgi:hypothetical protein
MIQQQLWKRLNTVEQNGQLTSRQWITVVKDRGETDADIDAKIERWKCGEVVDGINGTYKGGEIDIILIVIVAPSDVERNT